MSRTKKIVAAVLLPITLLFLVLTVYTLWPSLFVKTEQTDAGQPGALANSLENYLRESFPGRDLFRSLRNRLDVLLGKSQVGNVYIRDDRLFEELPLPNADQVQASLEAINRFSAGNHSRIYFLAVPTQVEFLPNVLPAYEPVWSQRAFSKDFLRSLTGSVTEIDIYADLVDEQNNGIYFNTQTLWTQYGAYIGYRAFASVTGLYPRTLDKYSREVLSHNFCGTLYHQINETAGKPDRIDLYYDPHSPDADTVFRYDANGNATEFDSVFFRSYLDTEQQEKVFLGEDAPLVRVETSVANARKLLLFGDDFADVLLPYFLRNYSQIDLVNLSLLTEATAKQILLEDYDAVLFVYGVDTLSQSDEFTRLSLIETPNE